MLITTKIVRIDKDKRAASTDKIVNEHSLELKINGKSHIKLMCLAEDLEQLCIGFLYNEGIITGMDDVKSVAFDRDSKTCEITIPENRAILNDKLLTKGSSGALSTEKKVFNPSRVLSEGFPIESRTIMQVMQRLVEESELFSETGAIHSCALCDTKGSFIYFAEDLGRHNTLDKTAGEILMKGFSTDNKFLAVSCRLTGEIVRKAVAMGVPLLVSKAAVTLEAVNIAEEYGITLIGFARGERMNIYTDQARVT